MPKTKEFLLRWAPAIALMLIIFAFSSRPSSSLPDFAWADRLVKKGGHMLGYAALALAYWYGLDWRRGKQPLAWLLAIAYAVTDEFHQAFVPGRTPSAFDILFFDNLGALLALFAYTSYRARASSSKPQ
jgi:VanZ family protein